MNYNYHTHTYLCSHADGTIREYIDCAIEGGIKYMGFADHIPFILPDGSEDGFRVPMKKAVDYINEITKLRDEYKNEIEIKIGFESEYYPLYFDDMLSFAKNIGAEYFILGHHFILNEQPPAVHSCRQKNDANALEIYVNEICEGMKTGYFSYVAHPDVFTFLGDQNLYKEKVRRICETSKETNIPIEVNFLGLREGRFYPHNEFWEVAGEVGCPVTFGMDSHSPEAAADFRSCAKAKQMVKKFNLNYIGKPDIILI